MIPAVTLLGPQRPRATVDVVLDELGVRGPVAVITAGWQERETDASALPPLPVATVNLGLHARADDVFRKDRELAAATKARQARLKLMQDFYRVRLDKADEAARAISVRHVDPGLLAEEAVASVQVVRQLDADHLTRCRGVHDDLERTLRAAERPVVAEHRRQLAALIAPTDAIVIAGGHIAVLLNRIRLFSVAELFGDRPIVAWSAGAMTLGERVVLFHDNPPHGGPIAEVLDAGLGRVRDVVVLPDPALRLRLDDPARVAAYARRFAPAICVAMDSHARLDVAGGRVVGGAGLRVLGGDGVVTGELP